MLCDFSKIQCSCQRERGAKLLMRMKRWEKRHVILEQLELYYTYLWEKIINKVTIG